MLSAPEPLKLGRPAIRWQNVSVSKADSFLLLAGASELRLDCRPARIPCASDVGNGLHFARFHVTAGRQVATDKQAFGCLTLKIYNT